MIPDGNITYALSAFYSINEYNMTNKINILYKLKIQFKGKCRKAAVIHKILLLLFFIQNKLATGHSFIYCNMTIKASRLDNNIALG